MAVHSIELCAGVGMLGVVEDILADRAFVEQRQRSAAEIAEDRGEDVAADVRRQNDR